MSTGVATGGTGRGCANHADRLPVGRCSQCRRMVCDECHTRLEGILHCRDCLRETTRRLQTTRAPILPRVATAVLAVCVLLGTLAVSWGFVRTAGLGAGRITRFFTVTFGEAADE